MGGRSWVPPDQRDWMEERIDSFRKAQGDTATKDWLESTKQAYFDKFWRDPKTGKSLDSILNSEGSVITKATRGNQLKWWFWNRRVGKSKAKHSSNASPLDLKPKKPVRLHAYQAYMALHKERVMPMIKADYDEYRKEHAAAAEDVSGSETPEPAVSWWKFACTRAREMLEDESEEVKAEVEAYREEGMEHECSIEDMFAGEGVGDEESELDEDALHKRAVTIQQILDALPKTLQVVLERIEAQTGWKGTILVGGPRPESGKLSAISVHQGQTLNLGNPFPQAAGQKWKDTTEAFNQFILSCFAPDIGTRLHDAYQNGAKRDGSSPSPATSDTPSPSGGPSAETSPDGTTTTHNGGEERGSTTGKGTATGAQAKGDAEVVVENYEEDRAQTIRKNRELFEALGLADASAAIAPKARKKREKRKAVDENPTPRTTRRTSALAGATTTAGPLSATSTTATTTPPHNPPLEATEKQSSPSDNDASESPSGADIPPTSSTQSSPPAATLAATGSSPSASSGPTTTDLPSTAPETTMSPATSPFAQLKEASVQPTVAPPLTAAPGNNAQESPSQLPRTPPPSEGAIAGSNTPTPTSTVYSGTLTPASSAAASPAGIASALTAPSVPGPAPVSTSGPVAAATSTFTVTTATATETNSAPEWVTDALVYFKLIEGGDGWTRLVDDWLAFERVLGYANGQENSKRLSSEYRPEEVKVWMKWHRSYEKLPKIKSPEQFAVAWKKWWVSLQPTSRIVDDTVWPLPRVEPVDPTEWDVVARGGNNGFFLVVLTLAWWLWAARNESSALEDVHSAVEDVSWVCRTITTYVKEHRDDDERPAKRQRLE